MKKTLTISLLLVLAIFISSVSVEAKDRKAYWGFSVGQMSYEESGTVFGTDYSADYSLNSFSTQLGVRINENLSAEARYAFSNTEEEDVLGTPVELQVSRVIAGFAKFKPNTEKNGLTPYGLVGYADAEAEACGTSCSTDSASDLAYGAGLQVPLGESGNALKIEYVFYGESTSSTSTSSSTAELSGINVGVLF